MKGSRWFALSAFLTLLVVAAVIMTSCARAATGPVVEEEMPYPRIASYSNTRTTGYPLVKENSFTAPLDSVRIKRQSRYPLMTINVATAKARPDIIRALRHYNPNIKLLGYQLLTHWYLSSTFVPHPNDTSHPAEWQRALLATNGFVPNAPDGYEVDWSKWNTADTLTSLLVDAGESTHLDGIFGDYWATCVTWTGSSNPTKDTLRVANMRRLLSRLRDVRPGFLVHGNADACGVKLGLDADMEEGYPNTLTTFQEAMAQRDGDWLKGEGPTNNTKLARFILGTACLTGAMAEYGGNATFDTTTHSSSYWFAEYSVRRDGTSDDSGANIGWLGRALGPAYTMAGGLFRRDFEHGVVIVNPTTSMHVGYDMLTTRYRQVPNVAPNVQGQAKYNIASSDALFLQVVGK